LFWRQRAPVAKRKGGEMQKKKARKNKGKEAQSKKRGVTKSRQQVGGEETKEAPKGDVVKGNKNLKPQHGDVVCS